MEKRSEIDVKKEKTKERLTCYALTLCLAKETRDKSSARREEETKMARKG
jgi:hypothetical protein